MWWIYDTGFVKNIITDNKKTPVRVNRGFFVCTDKYVMSGIIRVGELRQLDRYNHGDH